VDCILGDKTPAVSARDGYKALALAIRIRDSIQQRLKTHKNLPSGEEDVRHSFEHDKGNSTEPDQPLEAFIGAVENG
jgi:hypothetical protein